MATYGFTVRPANATAGQINIGGKEVAFAANELPDSKANPLHRAVAELFREDGTGTITSGTVTVTATAS